MHKEDYWRVVLRFAALIFLYSGVVLPGFAQSHKVLCTNGNRGFSATLGSGVGVDIGPQKSSGLAGRTCAASLTWNGDKLTIVQDAYEADLDMFGSELEGVGPVAAFQVKASAAQCCRDYLLYSLKDAPHFVRKIQGGFFNARDTNLDGRIEIWAEDSASIDSFDGLFSTQLEFPPLLVLRFEKGRLLDVTPEFASYFDSVVATVQAQIDENVQQAFKNTDGRPQFSVADAQKFGALQRVKAQALEIVWAYLYSGREQQAWAALAQMWPASDVERIRAIIINARKNGILAQVDGQSTSAIRKKKIHIFDAAGVHKPVPIMMWTPEVGAMMNSRLITCNVTAWLLIDSAGKVYSVTPTNVKTLRDDNCRVLIDTAKQWRFVPATVHGHPVASEIELRISLKR